MQNEGVSFRGGAVVAKWEYRGCCLIVRTACSGSGRQLRCRSPKMPDECGQAASRGGAVLRILAGVMGLKGTFRKEGSVMRTGRPVYLSRLWRIGIGAVASVAMLLPMGAVANAAEEGAKGSAAASASTAAGGASAAAGDIPITAKYFPDAAFRESLRYSLNGDGYDTNGDGVLSSSERNAITEVDLEPFVKSAKGIEWFPNLSVLQSSSGSSEGGTQLSFLDVSHNPKLTDLNLDGTQLTSVDVSHNPKLQSLQITGKTQYTNGKRLPSLDVSHNPQLTLLYLDGNQLSSLDVSHNPQLEKLAVGDNRLSSLDVSHNVKLEDLSVDGNQLASLKLSNNVELDSLDVSNNRLSTLDVSHNSRLSSIEVSGNRLSSLDVSHNPDLTYLRVGNNPLTALDVSHNPKITLLEMRNTRISSLDVSHNTKLESLNIQGSQLYALDASKAHLEWYDTDLTSNRLLAYQESSNRSRVYMSGQRAYSVDGRSLNLRQLIPWFDLSKVSNVRGGTISRTGVIAPVAGAKAGAVV
ncbi:leucine-rich repeat domain-containing protein, partial [Bifidobacterium simiarum]|uniref:leucine-rich repeat domain-containing protein n=1 Tax=Bifidobacterium simiarum TaxID=2045441 RepID=UPI003B8A73C3|nr:hypothetical protein [Bifidobacterium simiarum]